jgi:hypothetical protein
VALRAAKERLACRRDGEPQEEPEADALSLQFDTRAIVARVAGREGWLREARVQVAAKRQREARPIARGRRRRLLEGPRRLEEDHAAEVEAMRAYEDFRAHGRDRQGQRLSSAPRKPYVPPQEPAGTVNTTDPDSRVMKTMGQPGNQR